MVCFPAGSGEATSSGLDNSLTNIQWLGKMSSDGLGPCTVKQEMEKENQTPVQERIKVREGDGGVHNRVNLWKLKTGMWVRTLKGSRHDKIWVT